MKAASSILTLLGALTAFADAASIPAYFQKQPVTRASIDPQQVQRELGSQLSPGSVIFGPDDNRYSNATSRWNIYAVPQVQVVVEPALESDVPTIVKYCNSNSFEFLTYNRGHGYPTSLATFNGIQINMVQLSKITVQPGGKSAIFQGGVYDGQANRELWAQGYVAATGSCNCVGLFGPTLGGGHGPLEGFYGMVSDNIRQLNVVLADGSAVVVNSTSNSDLLWAMKGAGHNFGIVTSAEMSIYPQGPKLWHYHNYQWAANKLDQVFTALNKFHGNGSTPVNMAINFGNFFVNTTVSTTEPVIRWTFAYRGSAADAEHLLVDFNKIQAIDQEQGDVSYPDVSIVQGDDENGALCQHDKKRITSTAGLQVYNLTAERLIMQGFKNRMKSNFALAVGADIVHEGYSTAAVDAANPDDSAYPFRADHHLMLFDLSVTPNDQKLQDAGLKWAAEVRDQWNQGQPGRQPHAYVNYANGMESLQEMYGYESWRLQRLNGLKKKYDPQNRFRFYNPIVKS